MVEAPAINRRGLDRPHPLHSGALVLTMSRTGALPTSTTRLDSFHRHRSGKGYPFRDLWLIVARSVLESPAVTRAETLSALGRGFHPSLQPRQRRRGDLASHLPPRTA